MWPQKGVDADPDVQRAVAATAAARAAADAAPPAPTQANITDADNRIMKTATGWVQGYNAQAAVNENQVVVAAVVTQDANDVHQYQPMVAATRTALDAAGITDTIGCVLADAGYWSDDNANAEGPDRLIATLKDHKQRRAARDLGPPRGLHPKAPPPSRPWSTGCAPPRAQPDTPSDPTRSSPSSVTTRRTAATGGSADAACPLRRANGP